MLCFINFIIHFPNHQLYIYGFKRTTNIFSHPQFVRGKIWLTLSMVRRKQKTNNSAATTASTTTTTTNKKKKKKKKVEMMNHFHESTAPRTTGARRPSGKDSSTLSVHNMSNPPPGYPPTTTTTTTTTTREATMQTAPSTLLPQLPLSMNRNRRNIGIDSFFWYENNENDSGTCCTIDTTAATTTTSYPPGYNLVSEHGQGGEGEGEGGEWPPSWLLLEYNLLTPRTIEEMIMDDSNKLDRTFVQQLSHIFSTQRHTLHY